MILIKYEVIKKKEDYIEIIKKRRLGKVSSSLIDQVNNFYKYNSCNYKFNNYTIGDRVLLKKGTLLHGTYKNFDGLKEIVRDGLVSSWFIEGILVGRKYEQDDNILKEMKTLLSGVYICNLDGIVIR